jgi:TonB C terminal
VSLAIHLWLLAVIPPYIGTLLEKDVLLRMNDVPVSNVVLLPDEDLDVDKPEPEEEPEKEPPMPDGQIVDIPPPKVEEVPDKADYLAYDQKVLEETRTQNFRVNPEVLAPTFSSDDKLEFEDLMDLGVKEPSTGAQAGLERFDPGRDGTLASVDSRFTLTNKEGLASPVPASHSDQNLAGAPNNDLLDEKIGAAVNLNAREFLYRDYYNRIRRLVNFYWNQNLQNLPHSVVLMKPRYETRVNVVLDGGGAVEALEITHESGVGPVDNCVVEAFRIAGPFPNPPEQLVAKDGRVYLGDMDWTVEIGHAQAPYMGVDPRAGVQFPGILKATQ